MPAASVAQSGPKGEPERYGQHAQGNKNLSRLVFDSEQPRNRANHENGRGFEREFDD